MRYDIRMRRSLTIKIIFAIVLLASLALGGYALWKNAGNRDAEQQAKIASARESKPESDNETAVIADSDSDGLQDWEEKLWKTDPNNPDSDKDGANDGDEIAQNRNPLKKGPNDTLQTVSNQNVALPKPNTSAINNNATVNQQTILQPTEQIEQPPGAQSVQQTVNPEQTALKTYGNKAGEALLRYAKEWKKELNSFTNAIKGTMQEKEEARKTLREVAEEYRGRANTLQTITPPTELAALHQDLIIKYENQATNIELIAGAVGSGVSGEQWKIYNDAVEAAGKAFVAVSLFFKERGISFGQNEDGSLFNLPPQ